MSDQVMSALGQCAAHKPMSALPPKADMCGAKRNVRFVPIADIASEKTTKRAANCKRLYGSPSCRNGWLVSARIIKGSPTASGKSQYVKWGRFFQSGSCGPLST